MSEDGGVGLLTIDQNLMGMSRDEIKGKKFGRCIHKVNYFIDFGRFNLTYAD